MKGMQNVKSYFILICTLLWATASFAQVKVNHNGIICKGNLATFSYTPPAGVSIASYQWNFGDGFSNQTAKPNHLYKSAGVFNVTLVAVKSGGGTINGSTSVNVVNLPNANFVMTPYSDSCSNNNNICFQDLSIPAAAGQKITSRLTIWGDGVYDKNNQPSVMPTNCHTYKAVDKYDISIEITDKYGCKDFVTKSIEIIPGIEAKMANEVTFPKCGEAKLCVKNESVQANGIGASYDWKFNAVTSNKTHITTPYCYLTTGAEHFNVQLIAKSANGCVDTAHEELDLVADTVNRKMYANFSEICYGDHSVIRFWIDSLANDTVTWHLDDSLMTSNHGSIVLGTKRNELLPGVHTLKCKIKRGNCITNLQKDIIVKGPVAHMEIFNGTQCATNRKVFFVGDKDEQFTPDYTYNWELTDPHGQSCTADRANDVNKYKNCNTSTDWWHKHTYTDMINGYRVKLTVKDTIEGCQDVIISAVNLDACGSCKDPCGPKFICQNTWLFQEKRVPNDPTHVSFDSGATWVNYPVFIDSTYLGTYDLGYIFKYKLPSYARDFGDDSIQIIRDPNIYNDTIICAGNLTVLPNPRNSFKLAAGVTCNPLEIVAKLEKTQFNAGDSIIFKWADSMELVVTHPYNFTLDSVILKVNASGYKGSVSADFITQGACSNYYSDTITIGFLAKLETLGPLCTNSSFCFDADIISVSQSSKWSTQNGLGQIKWELDSLSIANSGFTYCPKGIGSGVHSISIMLEDLDGCKDTLHQIFTVQEVRANVTGESRNFYCNQLRQFFDSSEVVFKDSGDRISKHWWDFGTGKYSTLEKDPFRSFVGISDDIYVSHIVESESGCRDTLDFVLGIIGSKPKFSIKDSVGCAPLEVEFFNESENASQYIWEFGDHTNATLNTFDDGNVKFKYTKAGRYFINLVGIDTVYNPYTGSAYYCHSNFPGKGKKIWVNVLPTYKTGIESPDTICVGEYISFKSLSDSGYIVDQWRMGDGSAYTQGAGKPLTYYYKQSGFYNISLLPRAPRLQNQPYCHDSFASKKITVLGITADFSIDNQEPIFNFTNQSNPLTANWQWDFDHNGSAATTQDASYNYGKDNGRYQVCLTATLPFGCKDETCKWIESNYKESIKTYNVFTPGVVDGINDEFDIEVEGESKYQLVIFNRYGAKVFEGNVDGLNGEDINWNGTMDNKGARCAAGTYYYTFNYSYKRIPEKEFQVNGVITLIW